MNIMLLAIGKKHDPKLESAIEDYTKRVSHYTKIQWNLVEAKVTSSMTTDQIKKIESDVLMQNIPNSSTVILLDESGLQLDSPELAQKLQHYMNIATKQLIFVIGGAYGVDESVMKRADYIWSLSRLVLPHQLVRLVLTEQLYRAHTILAGEKYHHM